MPPVARTTFLLLHLVVTASSFGVDVLHGRRQKCPPWTTTTTCSGSTNGESAGAADDSNEPDLFEYFDPLLSPHAYPDGISPDKKPVETTQTQDEQMSPIVKKTFGFDLNGGGSAVESATSLSNQKGAEQVDTETVFDPRISPHEYASGTPDKVFGFEQQPPTPVTRVGILLMDHGSRNPASNERLVQVARVYQESLNDPNTIVRAAHMEIASPSIPEALESLLAENVDQIVCHPYFLSPGRHVVEDIPEIVQSAITTLGIEIPIVTTDPLGSETDIMIRAIHTSVKRTAAFT